MCLFVCLCIGVGDTTQCAVTDMPKVDRDHGSPSFTLIKLQLGWEHTGNIPGMISQWKDMECKEKEEEERVMEMETGGREKANELVN